jgi:hypothetical protein
VEKEEEKDCHCRFVSLVMIVSSVGVDCIKRSYDMRKLIPMTIEHSYILVETSGSLPKNASAIPRR